MQNEQKKLEPQRPSPMFELLFNTVPNSERLLFILNAIEPQLGRELKNKEIIASLIISFYEGRKRILESERKRYGEKMEAFVPPPVFLRTKGMVASYLPKTHQVCINLLLLEQVAALPQDLKREWIHPKTGEVGMFSTPKEIYDAAGVEEFDHAIYFFLHPNESREHNNEQNTLTDHDSQFPEYHARGMQIKLGKEAGYSNETLHLLRSRLRNALPKLLRKRSR